MSYCAPGVGYKCDKSGVCSCFDRKALIRIIDGYNQKHSNKINYHKNASTKVLHNLLTQKFNDLCGPYEWCWLDMDFIKNDPYLETYIKPPIPQEQFQWLKTDNINKVMTQFETIYKNFKFFGPVPIDFDQVIIEIANIDLCDLFNNKGIRKLGFVFNLDPSTKGGSHWVSMFLCLDEFSIEYFDSFGVCPAPVEIQTLVRRLKKQAKKCLGKTLRYKCNPKQHQQETTECGVYSMYFIKSRLEGQSFDNICGNVILDGPMNLKRKLFFRPSINSNFYNKNNHENRT